VLLEETEKEVFHREKVFLPKRLIPSFGFDITD